jgi:hypothetical protein
MAIRISFSICIWLFLSANLLASEGRYFTSILKFSYLTLDESSSGIKLDGKGFDLNWELIVPPEELSSKFAFYLSLSKFDYGLPKGLPLANFDANTEVFTFGIKYSRGGNSERKLAKGTPYLKVGWDTAQIEASAQGAPGGESSIETGLVTGIGYEKLNNDYGWFVEWKRHDNEVIDDHSLAIGVMRPF